MTAAGWCWLRSGRIGVRFGGRRCRRVSCGFRRWSFRRFSMSATGGASSRPGVRGDAEGCSADGEALVPRRLEWLPWHEAFDLLAAVADLNQDLGEPGFRVGPEVRPPDHGCLPRRKPDRCRRRGNARREGSPEAAQETAASPRRTGPAAPRQIHCRRLNHRPRHHSP